jgi:peptidoglycan/xylan/chitin deacetylase (PgdA/CDA1 family)
VEVSAAIRMMINNSTARLPILMYHGILLSSADPLPSGWSRRHVIGASVFRAQLDAIAEHAMHPVCIADLDRNALPARPLAITFDDGHLSDHTIAAPQLEERGFTATFFIACAFMGRPGYLRREHVRELRVRGFEIGSHGLTHKRLSEVAPAELWREALDSKRRLEDLVGADVTSFALPRGAYNDAVLQALWAAGYRRIMTSDFGYARRQDSVMHRMGVMAHTTPRQFRAFLSAGPSWAAGHRLLKGIRKRIRLAAPRAAIASTRA